MTTEFPFGTAEPFDQTILLLYKDLHQYYSDGYVFALSNKTIGTYENKYKFSKNIIRSLWKIIVLTESFKDTNKIKKNLSKIKEYVDKHSLIKTCSKFVIQPNSLRKFIDKKYFDYDQKIDLLSMFHAKKSQEKGKKFENKMIRIIRKINSNFLTEDEQKEKKIGNQPTPDILFNEIVHNVHWIELKSYPGFYDQIKIYGILKQVKRYSDFYGKGILLMNEGFTHEFKKYIEKKTNKQVIVLSTDKKT